MKAKAVNTNNTPHGNALIFPKYGNAPMLFLEFLTLEKHSINLLRNDVENDVFIVHFYPSITANKKAAKYINDNL